MKKIQLWFGLAPYPLVYIDGQDVTHTVRWVTLKPGGIATAECLSQPVSLDENGGDLRWMWVTGEYEVLVKE